MTIDDLYKIFRSGESGAEKALFEKLSARFALLAEHKIRDSMDAQEIRQKALMIVFEKCRHLDIETSFSAWAHKVLQNEILKYYRTRSYHGALFLQTADGEQPQAIGNFDPELKMRMVDCVRKMCRANVRYARILNLAYQGYGTGEICRKLKITASNCYAILSRARSLLDRCLETGDIQ